MEKQTHDNIYSSKCNGQEASMSFFIAAMTTNQSNSIAFSNQHFLRVKLHCNIKISAENHFPKHFKVVNEEYFPNKPIVHEHFAEVFINHILTHIYSDNLKKTDIHGKVAAIIMSVK